MATSSAHEQIGWMLQQVAAALEPWITARGGWPDDTVAHRRRDPHQQLRVLLDEWHRTFRDYLTNSHKTYVHELRDVRNRWAHHDPFSEDDVWRALDTGQRLLEAIDARELADQLSAAKLRLNSSLPSEPTLPADPRVEKRRSQPALGNLRELGRSESERSVDALPPELVEPARRTLERLVGRAGGPSGRSPIPVDGVDLLADLFEAWALYHGSDDGSGVVWFGPTPGLWHALQGLVPIERTDRWNGLRKAVVEHLEGERGWVRESPPRGSRFLIPATR